MEVRVITLLHACTWRHHHRSPRVRLSLPVCLPRRSPSGCSCCSTTCTATSCPAQPRSHAPSCTGPLCRLCGTTSETAYPPNVPSSPYSRCSTVKPPSTLVSAPQCPSLAPPPPPAPWPVAPQARAHVGALLRRQQIEIGSEEGRIVV